MQAIRVNVVAATILLILLADSSVFSQQDTEKDKLRALMKTPPPWHDADVKVIMSGLLDPENKDLVIEGLKSDDQSMRNFAVTAATTLKPDWALPLCVEILRREPERHHTSLVELFQWKKYPAAVPELRRRLTQSPASVSLALAWQDDTGSVDAIRQIRETVRARFNKRRQDTESKLSLFAEVHGKDSEEYRRFKEQFIDGMLRLEELNRVRPLDIALARLVKDQAFLDAARKTLSSEDSLEARHAVISIGFCGTKADIGSLIPLLDNRHVRHAVVRALEWLTGVSFWQPTPMYWTVREKDVVPWKRWWQQQAGSGEEK